MNAIHVNSASAAASVFISIIFAVGSVKSITGKLSDAVLTNIAYGSVLLVFSLATLIACVTSPSPRRQLFLSIALCLAVLWSSVGLHHIWSEVTYSHNTTSQHYVSTHDVLFPGYGGFLCVFLVFLASCIANRDFRLSAGISVTCLLLCTFEIVNMFAYLQGTGLLLVLLALVYVYVCLSNIAKHYKASNSITADELDIKIPKKHQGSLYKDHIILMYALNAVCFTPFASHVIGITSDPCFSFPWLLVAGIFQVVVGVASLRQSDPHRAGNVIVYGLFWLGVGSTLMAESYLWRQMHFLIPTSAVLVLIFVLLFIVEFKKELFCSLYFLMTSLFALSLGVAGLQGTFTGVMGWVGLVFSLYGLAATTTRIVGLHVKFPLGKNSFEMQKIKDLVTALQGICSKKKTEEDISIKSDSSKLSADVMLGYSKYVDSQCVGFAVNAVAAFALIWVPFGSEPLILPWTVGFGGLIQFVVGFVSFSRGMTFESCSFLLYASFWSIWGPVRALSVFEEAEGVPLVIGLISFLLCGILFLGLSTTVNKLWMMASSAFCFLVIAFILHGLDVGNFGVFEIVVAIGYVVIFVYGFLAITLRNVRGRDVLPLGKPILQVSKLHSDGSKALFMDPRRATGVKKTADILNAGGICGIPTDTVYVLVAACHQPRAVERAYNTKKLAEDRPMSLWISNTNQIAGARRELGELCWSFMQEVWPSNVSLVLKKGEWMKSLGLGDAERLIGKPDSIAVRIPDSTITCHLIDQTGPIAVTSANPTGEADTTHHLQVLAKLGVKNCDGILADGPSAENIASTVVDCRNMSKGKIGFFRIGLTPKSKVEDMFEKVKLSMQDNASDSGTSSIDGLDNPAFDIEDDDDVIQNRGLRDNFYSNGPKLVHSAKTIGGKFAAGNTTNPIFIEKM